MAFSYTVFFGFVNFFASSPEIFLFDDFTKKLSPEDSTYIIDETILKQLRDKDRTIVMVTATTELLPFSDYLYIMEGGHVSQEGFFNIVKHSRPYQRMVKKENVSQKHPKIHQKTQKIKKKIFQKI